MEEAALYEEQNWNQRLEDDDRVAELEEMLKVRKLLFYCSYVLISNGVCVRMSLDSHLKMIQLSNQAVKMMTNNFIVLLVINK